VRFVPTDFTTGPAGSNAIQSKINDDWTFEINELAWTGVLRVRAPAAWALKSVILNGRDIADAPYDFQSADVNGLELVMTNRLAVIRGTVTDGNKPAASSVVVIFPEGETKWILPSRAVTATKTSSEGTFTITGVLAGRYRIIAVPEPPAVGLEWLMGLRALSTQVVVSENEGKSVILKLIRR
jgi:hypothetical protein